MLTDPEVVEMVMPAVLGDCRAIETYRHSPDPRLAASIAAPTGDADPKTSSGEAKAWSAHATGEFDLRIFSGGHFFVSTQAPQVLAVVADYLR